MIGSKPLYVAVAQRKEDRRARLQAQFSQMCPVAIPAHVAPRLPTYQPGAPRFGQQLFYGQAPPTLIPPQQFGYQQQLVHGIQPGVLLCLISSCQWFSRVCHPKGQDGDWLVVDLCNRHNTS
ncbi:polyadenylate-binding protein 2-like [Iris pallida]|uniref:Polyadenylate-binding protein 2-like n=1 Tax=Iris pallida TaxID=29817 RepID=A0AAX6DRJ2_IRIPA|nr:polyadenylate-binding protein 2-like [Iris pallida]